MIGYALISQDLFVYFMNLLRRQRPISVTVWAIYASNWGKSFLSENVFRNNILVTQSNLEQALYSLKTEF